MAYFQGKVAFRQLIFGGYLVAITRILGFNDTAEFTLCYGLHDCSPPFQGYFIHSLSTLYYYNAPSLATRLTGDYRDRTYTGKCSPALLDTHIKKRTGKTLAKANFLSHASAVSHVLAGISPAVFQQAPIS